MQYFGDQLASGRFRNGTETRTPHLPHHYLLGDFNRASLGSDLLNIGDGRNAISPQIPTGRIMEELGSMGNPAPFLLVERQLNGAKGSIMGFRNPVNLGSGHRLDRLIQAVRLNPGTRPINAMFANIRAASVSIGIEVKPD